MKVSCLIFMFLLLEKLTYQKQIEGFKDFGGIFFSAALLSVADLILLCNFRKKCPDF